MISSSSVNAVSDPLAGAQFSRTCTPCDSNCKTCIFDTRKCTSCFDGYKLNDTICFSNYAVGFILELGNDFTQFLSQSLSQDVITSVANALNVS